MTPSATLCLSISLALLSLYSAQKSYIAITNLQQYEERSEKAAKHFDKAAHDLQKTRSTQASAAAPIIFSLVSSIALCFQCPGAPVLASANLLAAAAAYSHLTGFWKLKPEVPFVTGFNEGIRKSNDLRQLLVYLSAGWALTGVAAFLEV